MKKMISLSAALLLALGASQASLAQGKGNDNDKGGGPDKAQGQGGERGKASPGGQGKGNQAAQGNQGAQTKGKGAEDRAARPDQGPQRQADRQQGPAAKGGGRDQERGERVVVQGRDDRVVIREGGDRRGGDRDGRFVAFNPYADRGLIAGCPPGLAKRNNGCMPPGQERQMERARFDDWLWDRSLDDDFRYRYDDGYLYRFDQRGGLLGYIPVLGGALAIGNPWPTQYRYEPAPDYYSRYYGLDDPYDYRYAGGALYQVDPQTQAINAVVALLTGQPMTVGQPMPVGYDVYNVPSAYRAQYYDTPERMYRYNDGYVYQVDPTTQLITTVIELLV